MAEAAPNTRRGGRHGARGLRKGAPRRKSPRHGEGSQEHRGRKCGRQARRKVALIGDVHANLQALTAALADIDRRRPDEIHHVGDLIGFGPSPDEVVDLLRRRGITGVIGNVDQACLRLRGTADGESSPDLKHRMMAWTYKQLSPANRRYLEALPEQLPLDVLGRSVLLVHGSPDSVDEYIEDGVSGRRLDELARMAKADVVVAGHSHKPFVAQSSGTLFVNTGSVGRPDAGGSRSCYAMLTVGPSGVRVRHYQPRYDIEAAVQSVRRAGMGEVFERMIRTGQKYKQAKAAVAGPPPRAVPPQVHRLAGAFGDSGHSHVTGLALSMFDQIAGRLGLGAQDRVLLECAGLLHDIGWAFGRAGHHKQSMRMILAEKDLGLSRPDQLVAANIARYHRRALPSLGHAGYRRLGESDRRRVCILGGLLRLADALDEQHLRRVRQVELTLTSRRLIVKCRTVGAAAGEKAAAQDKRDLLRKALARRVELEWNSGPA